MPTLLTLPDASAPEGPVAPHVVLVGLPGAGKTTIGRALADAVQRPFLDFDAEIERRTDATVAEIFASRGEPHFRQLEQDLTREVAAWRGGMILSPGGGWITNSGVVAALRPPARMIWLKVRPTEAVRRLGEQAQRRPLLNRMNPTAGLEQLLKDREARYATADLAINTEIFLIPRILERLQMEVAKWDMA
jgi:shikimate kinase